ncbi:hypothetical protein NST16_20620 [Bacillus sp. FSL K6-1005]|uniref:hypothetical protein n=1 Tax=Bacillus sp. FSL K6-1005 TaxID=2954676 RepID=UPI0030F5D7C3
MKTSGITGRLTSLKEDVIDDFNITVIPVVLGTGIPLFHEQNTETKLGLPI